MDIALKVSLIGSGTSLLVAAIGLAAALFVAKIAADRETARVFALKRHEAILEAAKILLDRKNLYLQMLTAFLMHGLGTILRPHPHPAHS